MFCIRNNYSKEENIKENKRKGIIYHIICLLYFCIILFFSKKKAFQYISYANVICIIRLSYSIIKYCNLISNVIMTREGILEKYCFGYKNGNSIVEDFVIHGLH